MMDNKAKHAGGNIAEIIIVVLILVAVNYLGYKFFTRVDITENQLYTISDATKKILGNLDDPVGVDFYLSKDLPPQLLSVRDDVLFKLEEFEAFSNGNFMVKQIDPGDDEEAKEKAANQGVRELEIQVTEKDALSVKRVFFGLVMHYEDKSEAIPIAADPTSLEYELTSRLVKLTLDKKPKIALYAQEMQTNEQQQGPTYQGMREVLAGATGLYDFVELDPQNDRTLPDDIDAVFICGAFGMSDSLKYSIDQFLLNGGRVLVALDPMMVAGQQGGLSQAYPSLPTMEEQLEKYGVKFNKKLVADPACARAQFSAGMFSLVQPYWLWPQIGPEGFSKDVSSVANLEALVMPYSCPLEPKDTEGVEFHSLAQTSDQAFLLNSPFELSPEQKWDVKATESESRGPYALACLVEGAIPTAFPGGPPKPPARGEGEEDVVTMDPTFDPSAHKDRGEGGKLVVMSSASALSDNFLRQFRENVLYLANTADMLLLGDDLLGIRSTPVTARPIKQMEESERNLLRWANILVVPVLLVCFGMLLWYLKGIRRRAIQASFENK